MNNKNKHCFYTAAAILLFFISACGAPNAKFIPSDVVLENAFLNLHFEQPIDLQMAPGSGRFYVVEQKGVIRSFANDPQVKESRIFLDLTNQVHLGGMEEGMLGLAFHPRFSENGYFYVDYIANNPRRSVIARFKADPKNPQAADPLSQFIILEVAQPYDNHNGGQISFGPDGFLYIALGDGGSGGDPHNHGQDRSTLLGSILRIDVNQSAGSTHYAIPPDNPFAGNTSGYREEIFAYGLRNPWRFSFDPATGLLWAGDVGQYKPYEEVDIITKGGNYGWNIMEGFHCFKPARDCPQEGLTLPIWEYTLEDGGRSITGGHVYRGKNIPALTGQYIYADFVSGRVWALEFDGKRAVHNQLLIHNSNLYPSTFGRDQNGELYICSFDGNIYKLTRQKSDNKKDIKLNS